MDGYKIYIRLDDRNRVIFGNTSGFPELAMEGDICIAEGGPRQFSQFWPEPLWNQKGQLLFSWINGQRIERSQTELDGELATLPVPPDPDAELAAAIQAATTLTELKAALLGSGGKTARVKGKIK